MDAETPPPPPPELGMVARAVQRLVARNDAAAEGDRRAVVGIVNGMAVFEAAGRKGAARIGVGEYLERVHRYAGLEAECYVAAYAYLDMAAHRRPAAAVASRNVHRLLLACLLLASKVLDDFHHNNAFFARVGGVSNAEMNKLELELLAVLDFRVMLSRRLYDLYRAHLHKSSQPTTASPPTEYHVKVKQQQPEEELRSPDADDGDGEVDDDVQQHRTTTKLQPNGAVIHDWSEVMANGGAGVRRQAPARYSFSA